MEQFLPVFVLAIAFAAVSATEDCIEGKNNVKVCTEKPSYFDEFVNSMNASLHENFELMNTYHGEDLEETAYENIGSELNCPSVTKVLKPFVYIGDAENKLIVQTSIFEQKIQSTKCMDSSDMDRESDQSECFKSLAFGWKGKCNTKYATVDLVVYNMESKKIEKVSTDLPVCCYCAIYQ